MQTRARLDPLWSVYQVMGCVGEDWQPTAEYVHEGTAQPLYDKPQLETGPSRPSVSEALQVDLVLGHPYLLESARYTHLNPVGAISPHYLGIKR